MLFFEVRVQVGMNSAQAVPGGKTRYNRLDSYLRKI
jgi:hypothetical protein